MNPLALLDIGSKIIDRVWPDPQQRDAAKLELLKLQQAGEFKELEADLQANLAQIEVNKAEATNGNLFVSGWRPAVGWVCVSGLAYTFLVRPLLTYFGKTEAPAIDIGSLIILLTGMLGFGGMRTYEKLNGVARQ